MGYSAVYDSRIIHNDLLNIYRRILFKNFSKYNSYWNADILLKYWIIFILFLFSLCSILSKKLNNKLIESVILLFSEFIIIPMYSTYIYYMQRNSTKHISVLRFKIHSFTNSFYKNQCHLHPQKESHMYNKVLKNTNRKVCIRNHYHVIIHKHRKKNFWDKYKFSKS